MDCENGGKRGASEEEEGEEGGGSRGVRCSLDMSSRLGGLMR
jgi:hypothetical protein